MPRTAARKKPRRQAELQSDETRRALLRSARQEFARRGYEGTSAEKIAQRAGITRAGLYYHFKDKRTLFLEVCDELERECSERITIAGQSVSGTWAQLRAGCEAALDTYLDSTYQRIMVRDGPGVLGWRAWRDLLAKYGRGLLRLGMERALKEGLIAQQPLDPLVDVLTGAVNEAGLVIAHSKNARASRKVLGETVRRLLDGLRVEKPKAC